MAKRLAGAADTALFGRVQADNRGALGQPVTLEDRQAQRVGALQQLRGNPATTDGDETQRMRYRQLALAGADQRQQQLRQQDQTVRLSGVQRLEKARQVEATGTGQADLGHGQQFDPGAGQQRRVNPGDVLQQGGQRQDAQVPLHLAAGAGLDQAVGHRQLRVQIQTHALGLAGGAGGVGDLAGAGMQLGRLCHRAAMNVVLDGDETRSAVADQAVDAGTVEHMALLIGGE